MIRKIKFLLPAAVAFFLICGCGGTREVIREVPVEVPVYHTTATHDTIREYHHTTTDRTKDTIYKIEVHEYRHIHHDTVHDSVSVPVYLHDTLTITKPCEDSSLWPLWPLWVALGGLVAIVLALYYAIRLMLR